MTIVLTISANKKESLKKFVIAIKKLYCLKLESFVVLESKKKRVVSVLKSPHVNKSAQEQFEFIVHNQKITIKTRSVSKTYLAILKLRKKGFANVSIKLESTTNSFFFSERLNPDKYILQTYSKATKSQKKIGDYLMLFDCYGEILLKKHFSKTKK